jgi:hypothetical protein
MKLSKLLNTYGLDTDKRIKIVRHSDKNRGYDLDLLYELDQLEIYQSYQENPDFHDCDYLVSFLGTERTHAAFIGVYKVLGYKPASEIPLPKDFYYYDIYKPNRNFFYELERDVRFDEFKERLIIDWGGGTLKWEQRFPKNDKEVVKILPKGYIRHFPGYLDFLVTHDELKKIIAYPDAHHDWHQALKAVAGVYIIVDKISGKQYIGSACGKEGILGRFKDYSKNGHGENVELKRLLKKDPLYARNFQYSLLETLPISRTKKEVDAREQLYKKKLFSREHGLNRN